MGKDELEILACQTLYKKRIPVKEVVISNNGDILITLDYDKLSEKNKIILNELIRENSEKPINGVSKNNIIISKGTLINGSFKEYEVVYLAELNSKGKKPSENERNKAFKLNELIGKFQEQTLTYDKNKKSNVSPKDLAKLPLKTNTKGLGNIKNRFNRFRGGR